MTPDKAIEEGALALFGEKYGDEVRVVTMGGPAEDAARSNWSVELCGGTHVNRTGDIAILKIISESAVAGGVRRIEAVTQQGAESWLSHRDELLVEAATILKASAEKVPERVSQLLDERRKMEREIAAGVGHWWQAAMRPRPLAIVLCRQSAGGHTCARFEIYGRCAAGQPDRPGDLPDCD